MVAVRELAHFLLDRFRGIGGCYAQLALAVQKNSRRQTLHLFSGKQGQGLAVTEADLLRVTPLIQERIRTLDEAVEMAGFLFEETVSPAPEDLIGQSLSAADSAAAAKRARELISGFERLEVGPLEAALRELANELSLQVGQLFGILRVAVTGQRVSPPLIETMELLGKQIVLARIDQAIRQLEALG